MTQSRWLAQIALRRLLEDGTQVVAADAMQIPMIALHPRIRFLPATPEVLLDTGTDGIIVRDGTRAAPCGSHRRLAIAPTLAEAAELGRRVWRRAAHLASDGLRLTGMGDRWPQPARALVVPPIHRRAPAGPEDILPLVKDIGETEILGAGEGVLWIDPLRCLRNLSPRDALRLAWRGRPDCGDLPAMHLSVPDGRVRLQFEQVRSRPRLTIAGTCRVCRVSKTVIDLDTGSRPSGMAKILVHAPRARLARIGIVIRARPVAAEPALADRLAVYADPLDAEYLS